MGSTSFEHTVDDTSPLISYFPFAETLGAPNLTAGWNSFFSENGFLQQLGETGNGTSFHITSQDGAAFTLEWFGSGVSLFGNAVEAVYHVSLDGATPTLGLPRDDLLVRYEGLENKKHLVALMAQPAASLNTSSFVAFDKAVVETTVPLINATISHEFLDVDSPDWMFSGAWLPTSDPLVDTDSQALQLSLRQGSTASIQFNGSAVALMGIRDFDHGPYNVTLDGVTQTFNGRSNWKEASLLFLQSGLDQGTIHNLTVTNANSLSLSISGINVTHVTGGVLPPPAGSSKALAPGTIAAIVLGAVFGLLALLSLALCVFFRRRSHRQRIVDKSIQITQPTSFVPFNNAHTPRPNSRDRKSWVEQLAASWAHLSAPQSIRPKHLSKNSDEFGSSPEYDFEKEPLSGRSRDMLQSTGDLERGEADVWRRKGIHLQDDDDAQIAQYARESASPVSLPTRPELLSRASNNSSASTIRPQNLRLQIPTPPALQSVAERPLPPRPLPPTPSQRRNELRDSQLLTPPADRRRSHRKSALLTRTPRMSRMSLAPRTGTSDAFSPASSAMQTVSTMKFGRPWDDPHEDDEGSSIRPPAPQLPESKILSRIRAQR